MHHAKWGTLLLLLASPALQGAGCTSHHSGRFKGQIQTDESLRYAHPGQKIVVIYRKRDAAASSCQDDWPKCLSEPGWEPLKACSAVDDGGKTATVIVTEGAAAQGFDACTKMIGVDYEADLAAFIDLDEDGKPSAGEPYGGYRDGPLTRDSEKQPLVIRISEALPE